MVAADTDRGDDRAGVVADQDTAGDGHQIALGQCHERIDELGVRRGASGQGSAADAHMQGTVGFTARDPLTQEAGAVFAGERDQKSGGVEHCNGHRRQVVAAGMQEGVFDYRAGLVVGDHCRTSVAGDGVLAAGFRCFHGDSPTPSLQGTRITAGRAELNALSNASRNSSGVCAVMPSAPKSSARRAKSGFTRVVPNVRPWKSRCWSSSTLPNELLSNTTATTLRPYCTAVAISCTPNMNPPSPVIDTTSRSGWAALTPSAVG